MKMLVTGATGFVGTWLTKLLLDRGHEVRILSRTGVADFPFGTNSVEIFRGDVTDKNCLTSATKDIDSVFHLAGVVGYSRAMREQMVLVNVVGTQNIVDACLKSGCRRLLHMSSVAAIGASLDGKNPLNESSNFNLHSYDLGYFETKLRAEEIVRDAVNNRKLNAIIVNPSTIYGPGDAKKGSRSVQVKVAKGKFKFYTSGGANIIHIDDMLSALYRAWEIGKIGERYILAGENITIKQLFSYIAESANVSAPYIYLPNPVVFALGKLGDAFEARGRKWFINSENARTSTLYHWFDNSKAKNDLGLTARPAREAIQSSVNWMKENGVLS